MTDPRSTPSIPVAPEEPFIPFMGIETDTDRDGHHWLHDPDNCPCGDDNPCACADPKFPEAYCPRHGASEARRHYPNDNCGNPEHHAILAAWYARAEAMLDRLAAANAGLELNGMEEERERLVARDD